MKKLLSLVLSILMCLSLNTAFAEDFEKTIDWDAEYDVVVVGYGNAGAVTAVTAADAGAKVLLLEKAPKGHEGGNSLVCAQIVGFSYDADETLKYLKALRGGFDTTSDEILEVYAQGLVDNWEWMKAMGANPVDMHAKREFSMLEGNESFSYFTVNGTLMDGSMYKWDQSLVEARADKIDVWYESRGTELIQDPVTKIVHGVVAVNNGTKVNIRAKNGVVLCTGGFENDSEMLQNYFSSHTIKSLGNATYNTGDGIRMAMRVGAKLWHMNNMAGPELNFYDETNGSMYQYLSNNLANKGAIYVSGTGKRFFDESEKIGHGKKYFYGTYIQHPIPDVMYAIFNDTAMNNGSIYPAWSLNNQEELAKGWIKKADTLEELAALIGIDADGLVSQVAKWNASCEAGLDEEFGRTTLIPIAEGPYYAMKLTPAVVNTQGGPERNAKGEVLDVDNNPIPHLYEAGELGDIWANLYQASCNMGGGLIFGRISGANAAAAKTDNYQGSVMEGKTPYQPVYTESAAVETADNQYVGEGYGKSSSPIVVRVTYADGVISNVEVIAHKETPTLSDRAFEQVPGAIVAANSADVDVVSGATLTSNGIMDAVKDALSKAR